MEKKLYRVKKGRMLFGVAAGAGEYFNVEPTIVRLVFIGITIAFSVRVSLVHHCCGVNAGKVGKRR